MYAPVVSECLLMESEKYFCSSSCEHCWLVVVSKFYK